MSVLTNIISLKDLDKKIYTECINANTIDNYSLNIYNNIINHDTIEGKIIEIKNFMNNDECASIIKYYENIGFGISPFRDSERIICMDKSIKKLLKRRLKSINIPISMVDATVNECIRLHKYTNSVGFPYHRDSSLKTNNKRSKYSIILYLNDNFDKGETTFIVDSPDISNRYSGLDISEELNIMKNKKEIIIKPEIGKLVIFDQTIIHKGCKNIGIKYLLRSDIIYYETRNQNGKTIDLMKNLFRQAQYHDLRGEKTNLYDIVSNLYQKMDIIEYPEHLEKYLDNKFKYNFKIFDDIIFKSRTGKVNIFEYNNMSDTSLIKCAYIAIILSTYEFINCDKDNLKRYLETIFKKINMIVPNIENIFEKSNRDEIRKKIKYVSPESSLNYILNKYGQGNCKIIKKKNNSCKKKYCKINLSGYKCLNVDDVICNLGCDHSKDRSYDFLLKYFDVDITYKIDKMDLYIKSYKINKNKITGKICIRNNVFKSNHASCDFETTINQVITDKQHNETYEVDFDIKFEIKNNELKIITIPLIIM